MDSLKPLLATIAAGGSLSRREAEAAFDHLLSGEATPAQMGAFVMGLRVRGETVDEITGAVAAMRAKMLRVAAPKGAIDIVGTGGDGHGTYNVSTLASIIVAACGVPVAKHGNRAASSRSGSSDVLTALGVAVGSGPASVEHCLSEVGLGFMAAPTYHAAMRNFAAVRSEIGTRTIFNLLGPLSNPAGVSRLLVGVFAEPWLEPLARVLGALGAERAWIVHGSDGLDEITTTGPTQVVAWEGGTIQRFVIDPRDLGLPPATLADLKGGDADHNAAALTGVLRGVTGPYRDIACLNAAAALVVADAAPDLKGGLSRAEEALDSGRAAAVLERLVRFSQGGARSAE
jgi:anthranilate phosphoribosyltransferase